jgi:hypothetical protein
MAQLLSLSFSNAGETLLEQLCPHPNSKADIHMSYLPLTRGKIILPIITPICDLEKIGRGEKKVRGGRGQTGKTREPVRHFPDNRREGQQLDNPTILYCSTKLKARDQFWTAVSLRLSSFLGSEIDTLPFLLVSSLCEPKTIGRGRASVWNEDGIPFDNASSPESIAADHASHLGRAGSIPTFCFDLRAFLLILVSAVHFPKIFFESTEGCSVTRIRADGNEANGSSFAASPFLVPFSPALDQCFP